ncbi:MAG TPA: hypothetical protein VNX68_07005, partial [Nitrosopumilaceae archaeon]|nr:hypothetical protein [Nitrosopumilaceae archaeon]
MPKLFSQSEFARLEKFTKKKILEEIKAHGLVRKTGTVRLKRTGKKSIFELERKSLPIRVFQRRGTIYTEYSYPFVSGGVVRKSTRVSATSEFGFKKQTINLPVNLERIHFISRVNEAEKLRKCIYKVRYEHRNRIRKEYRNAIESSKPLKAIQQIRRYFQRFYPAEFFAMENLIRQKAGIPALTLEEALKP